MNAATLEMMARIIESIKPSQTEWKWTGKNRSEFQAGITYNEARVLQLERGGQIEKVHA